jgi:hypothetical protein
MLSLRAARLVVPLAVYGVVAFYVYEPYSRHEGLSRYIVPVASVAASLGCFVLSRRWIAALPGSLVAGLIYGYGPFFLSFIFYHPLIVLFLAAIPWLFCPAAFWPLGNNRFVRTFATILLSLVPFLCVFFFFALCNRAGFFPVPKQAKLHLADMAALATPLALRPDRFSLSFYHVPVAGLVAGAVMFAAARRFRVGIIAAAGLVLAFCKPVWGVSPVVWAAMTVLCGSVVIGAGLQALSWATEKDQQWVLICGLVLAILALGTALVGQIAARVYLSAARMYGLGALAVFIIFFMARARTRACWIRWLILALAAGVDIVATARAIVDRAI